MSNTGDNVTMSDMGDGGVLSDWSVVDQHCELPDDDTVSTTSSVEIVDEDEDDTAKHSTPVAGSPSSVVPRFVLRLPSHEHDASDTDEDPVDNPCVGLPNMPDDRSDAELIAQLASSKPPSISSSIGLATGQTYRENATIAHVSMEDLDDLRHTLDLLKKNMQASAVDDSSLCSNEMFGEGRSDTNAGPIKTSADELLSRRLVENIGIHGDVLSDDVSMTSSVSSSYSFLSKDAGTNCSLVTEDIDTVDVSLTSLEDQQTLLEETANPELLDNDKLEHEEDDIPTEVVCDENGLKKFILIVSEFQVQFVVLAALICYTGLVIQFVLYCCLQGPAFHEKDAFSNCPRYNVELASSAKDDYSCNHGDDSCVITEDIESCKAMRDEEIESLRDEIERLGQQDKDATYTTVQVTFTLIINDLDHSHIKSNISEYEFAKEIGMMLQEKEEQFKLLLEESNEITDEIKNAQRNFVNLTNELAAIKDENEKTKVSMEVQECQGLMDKQTELYSENERLQGMLNESRTTNTEWKLYLENVKRQSERELYEVRRQCKTDLAILRKQVEADVQLSSEQYALNTEQDKGHSGKETAGAQANTKKDNDNNQSKNRNWKSADRRQRDENQSKDEDQSEKGSYSNSKSQREHYSGSMWADIVLDMMNKTRGQIEDTWAKVKNMSEGMWTKHKPTVYTLHDAFTQKLQNLSTRFQEKLMRKVNKWFRTDKPEQQENYGPHANTKRRKFNVHDHTMQSELTVESRLVKLSQRVAELNARKFNKWRHGPRIIDIQREFNNVELIIKIGHTMDGKDRQGLTDAQLMWFQCQFQWWKALDVVMVTDDCYVALCCWQVKVTGGDVKQCRKIKRKLGIVEDMCTPEYAAKYKKHDQGKQRYKTMSDPTKAEDHHDTPPESNSNAKNTKTEMKEDRPGEALNQFFKHKKSNTQNAEGGKQESTGVNGEDNWFLDMGEDREYLRDEPDNWFLRRKDTKVSEDEKQRRFTSLDIDVEDSDFEDENFFGNWDL